MRRLLGQFATFSAVGAAAAVGHYGVYIGLVAGAGADPVPATMAGFVLGAAMSYALNYRFTFRSAKRHREALMKFLAVAGVGFLLNSLIVGVLTGPAAMHYLLAQVIATGSVLVWNFGANRLWTFAVPAP